MGPPFRDTLIPELDEESDPVLEQTAIRQVLTSHRGPAMARGLFSIITISDGDNEI